jgi:tRNA (cmo5U34)-methyltransferase
MISDLVLQETEVLNDLIWEKYGDYLETLGGAEYRYKVLDYIDKEDSPRSLNYQLDLMKRTGFKSAEVLHKNICFAAYVAIK